MGSRISINTPCPCFPRERSHRKNSSYGAKFEQQQRLQRIIQESNDRNNVIVRQIVQQNQEFRQEKENNLKAVEQSKEDEHQRNIDRILKESKEKNKAALLQVSQQIQEENSIRRRKNIEKKAEIEKLKIQSKLDHEKKDREPNYTRNI
ncbi:DUF3523 domain-containing protein [Caenorhabditis elegans]|uniref:DUF3523 domain-containing protein n=1 Tax=Caenorhabditis elegans TaxID=6239 RepID=D1YSI0_CAEEL|nr:DUF3523 domain-containing protein [Caenorhabditis elegans]CCD72127.1 DUF3523 domain-containing protein [Caenorhabditis elegans]|eukprot:NP_001256030.1 Uncharacterized protein CELE_Y39H10B.3 [Caenorhabditis elegans]